MKPAAKMRRSERQAGIIERLERLLGIRQ